MPSFVPITCDVIPDYEVASSQSLGGGNRKPWGAYAGSATHSAPPPRLGAI